MEKINTIMFDLDGTLLSIDMKEFEQIFYKSLSKFFRDIVSAEDFMKIIYGSMKTVIENREKRTNEDVLMEALKERVLDDFPLYEKKFDEYYSSDFSLIKEAVTIRPEITEATDLLKEKGYELVIATNPIFPKIANEQRIAWSGVNRDHFSYVSYLELNHYTKPNVAYYEEILESIKKQPEECMMVGNDVLEDMAAKKIGITTYLITDHLLNRHDIEVVADHQGDYTDFLTFAKEMPYLA